MIGGLGRTGTYLTPSSSKKQEKYVHLSKEHLWFKEDWHGQWFKLKIRKQYMLSCHLSPDNKHLFGVRDWLKDFSKCYYCKMFRNRYFEKHNVNSNLTSSKDVIFSYIRGRGQKTLFWRKGRDPKNGHLSLKSTVTDTGISLPIYSLGGDLRFSAFTRRLLAVDFSSSVLFVSIMSPSSVEITCCCFRGFFLGEAPGGKSPGGIERLLASKARDGDTVLVVSGGTAEMEAKKLAF